MIRKYHQENKNQLLEILELNIPAYFAPSEKEDFIEYLESNSEHYFVMEKNGKIIGSGGINYFTEEQLARISWDIVHPDFQGKGIGKKITQFRIEEIKKNKTINTIVVRTSQLASGFYEKMGFKLEKTKKDFWAPGFDLYQMKMKI